MLIDLGLYLQVCNKAFARRDKLVIHMNKFKHVTPTNIAPLGKRHNNGTTVLGGGGGGSSSG